MRVLCKALQVTNSCSKATEMTGLRFGSTGIKKFVDVETANESSSQRKTVQRC